MLRARWHDGAVTRSPAAWDVDSSVQAEVFAVWLDDAQLALTGHAPERAADVEARRK